MCAISYDPIKNRLAGFIRNSRVLRRIFYFLLDLLFLRSWHIRRILKREGDKLDRKGKWKMLDAGCGFGQYERFLLSRFKNLEILAIDVKDDYLEDCRHYFQKEIEEGRIEFKRSDLLKLDIQREIDFIICIDVLEHIEEDQRVIQNLADSLKPGGQLLMHAPSHYSEEDADEGDSFVGEHARSGYSKRDISKKFQAAGVTPVKVHYTYGLFGHISWVFSVKIPIKILNKIGIAGLIILLFYFPVICIPSFLLNCLDLFTKNSKGNGIYALGRRI